MKFPSSRYRGRRRGSVLVLVCMFLMIFVAFVAMVVDGGYITNSTAELQRTADATALATCWEYAQQSTTLGDTFDTRTQATTYAQSLSTQNSVGGAGPSLQSSDVEWGRISDYQNQSEALDTTASLADTNAVRVTLRRTSALNGRIPCFFGKALGVQGIAATASATALIPRNIKGFKSPKGQNLPILPITLDEGTYNSWVAGAGSDSFAYDSTSESVGGGTDGIPECNLYPIGTGSPGNRGTVEIGNSNNSTSDLGRQIRDGISSHDLAYHGGSLEFNTSGELQLGGDPGLSNGLKDDLGAIIGQPRAIPVFRALTGSGNNTQYTIVKWVGVRIVYVNLTGNNKQVLIQPCTFSVPGGIPGTSASHSSNLFGSAMLVR